MDKVPITPAGHAAIKKELGLLIAYRPKIAQEIEVAREHGDLRENAEYHAAKEKQGLNEARIAELENGISRAEVIDPSKLSGDRIKFGATVELEDLDEEKEVTYQLVGPYEADLSKGTISVTSPVAKALIGREVGDEVRISTPGGVRSYEVVDVSWH
jgi:transcription elongation factor GreA